MKVLIWGARGWIGSMLCQLTELIQAKSRLGDYRAICSELDEIKPDRVLICAGITGKPNVDWCEKHIPETMFTNVIGTINVIDACWHRGIHVTNYASGCIYSYDENHPIGYSFSEEETPNYLVSTYSKSKVYAEQLIASYDNVLHLRIRLPVDDKAHEKNLLTKLLTFTHVINIPNSVSILPELLPISLDMSEKQLTGIYNFVNPGTITHPEILGYFDKECQIIEANNRRSQCHLSVEKLLKLYDVSEVHVAMEKIVNNYK
jgi:dTDP-4-dehydrorhamnose reductase